MARTIKLISPTPIIDKMIRGGQRLTRFRELRNKTFNSFTWSKKRRVWCNPLHIVQENRGRVSREHVYVNLHEHWSRGHLIKAMFRL